MSSVTGSRFGALDPNIGGSPPLLVDRAHEARAIARFIVDVGQRVVVLYGGARSGKTELVTHWIIPELEQAQGPLGWEVFYGKCDQGLPSILKSRSGNRRLDELEDERRLILVLDNFDRVLGLPKDQRAAACDALFGRVAQEGAEHIVVLVTDARQLTNVYGLSSYEPGLMKAIRELGTASVDESLHGLSSVAPESAVAYTDEALTVLSNDGSAIEERGFEVSFDLIVLVDRHFRELAKDGSGGTRTIDVSDIERVGGMIGILKAHMERGIQAAAETSAARAAVARTILEDVLSGRGAPPDRSDVALRVGVSTEEVHSVAAALLKPDGLLRQAGPHELTFFPPQLAAVVEDEVATDKPFVDQARRIVDEGLRSWTLLGDLLSGERFDEVHRWRRHLALDDERCRFLLLSALRLEDETKASAATAYWLARLEDREDAQDILLSATLDKDAKVRALGTQHVGAFANADVQARLTLLALVDDNAVVRAKAVTGLAGMKNESLRQRLVQEIESHGANRIRAIQVLQVFPDEKTVALLTKITSDPAAEQPIRAAAIAVLSTINTSESVDALIQIALRDVDEEDRSAAAVGLALTRTEERNRQILSTIGPLRHLPKVKWAIGAVAAVTVLTAIGLAIGALIFLAMVASAGVIASTVAAAVVLWFVSHRLMRARRAVQKEGKAKRGVFTVALLVVFVGPLCLVFHGLAHALVGRWRRASFLFAMELLGVFLFTIAGAFADVLFGVLQYFYAGVAVLLVAGSYFWDVLPILAETILVGRAVEQERRKENIYRHLLSNAEVVTLLLHQLRSDNKSERFAARRLVRRFADSAQPAQLIDFLDAGDPLYTEAATRGFRVTKDHDTVQQLESLWAKANPALRRRIADILCSSPTQSSIEALERVQPQLSMWSRLRYSFAKAEFRLRVWPIYLRALAVVSLPAVILFLVYGYSAMSNSAWSQLMAVDRYLHGASLDVIQARGRDADRQMVATVTFLARNYPADAAPKLIEHFQSEHPRATAPRMHAALARGLIMIQFDSTATAFHDRIRSMNPQLVKGILEADSATFARTTEELAGLRGTTISPSPATTALLQQIILTRGPDLVEDWKKGAIRSMASMHDSLALPGLSGLLKERSEGPLANVVRSEFANVIARRLDSAKAGREPGADAARLLSILKSLKPVPAETLLVRRFADSVEKGRASFRSDPAFIRITKDPEDEDAYTDLMTRLDNTRQYRAAVEGLSEVKRDHGASIWPRKVIAQIEHDKLADSDSTFRHSFDEMVGLRALPAYQKLRETNSDLYTSIGADFVEIALSARQYDDVERVADSLIKNTDLPLDRRLNAALFVYFGRVMQRDQARALDALAQVERLANDAPDNFYNNWVYPGTRVSLMRSGLPARVRDQLLTLCREQFWYSKDEAKPVFAANRAALSQLRK